jgi:hypothetical protein
MLELRRSQPGALLEQHHLESIARQLAGHYPARGTGPHDDEINLV